MVTSTVTGRQTQANSDARENAEDAALGWYFYGITRRATLPSELAAANDDETATPNDAAPLELLECSELMAVVRPVLLADFTPSVLQERLQNASELEAMVRDHNHVIEAIHAQQAILPAKFGSIYAHADEVVSALRPAVGSLLRQLDRLEGCDEWAVHLYADRNVAREQIAAEDVVIRRMREECASASRGRAYFLERQISDELETATQQALMTLAQDAYDRLARCAVDGQINPIGPEAGSDDEVEILRAAFLVARERSEEFLTEIRSHGETASGLQYEYSGPWPPYSFAIVNDVETQ